MRVTSSMSWTDRALVVTAVAAMVLTLLPATARADGITSVRIDGIDAVVSVGQVLDVSIVDTDDDGDPNESNGLLYSLPTSWTLLTGTLESAATSGTPTATVFQPNSLDGLLYETVGQNERVRADRYTISVPGGFSTSVGDTIVSFQVVVGEIYQDDLLGNPTTTPVFGTEFEVADVSAAGNAFARSTVARDVATFSPNGLFARPHEVIPVSITDGRDPAVTALLGTAQVAVTLPTTWGVDATGVPSTTTDNGDGTRTVAIDTTAVAAGTRPGDPILDLVLVADGDPAGADGATPDVVTFELRRNDGDAEPYQTAVFAVSTAPVTFAATLAPASTYVDSTVTLTVTDPRPAGSPELDVEALELLVGTEFATVTSGDVTLNNGLDAAVNPDGAQGYRIEAADPGAYPAIETTTGGGEVIATIDLRVVDAPGVVGTGAVRVAPVLVPRTPVTPTDVSTQIVADTSEPWTLTGGGFEGIAGPVTGPSPFIRVASDGTDGQPAVLEYDNDWRWNGTLSDGPGGTINPPITMERVATAAGDVTVPWDLSGFHAYAGVSVGLVAFQTDGATETTQVLYAPPVRSCCTTPSAGFAESGMVTFGALQPGQSYGFRITGGNGDANSRLLGTLVVGEAGPVAPPVAPDVAVFAAARDLQPAQGDPTMDVLGRLVGQPETPYLLEFAGALAGSSQCDVTVPVGEPVPVVTDAQGVVDFGASFTTADLPGDSLPDRIVVLAATELDAVDLGDGVYGTEAVARFDPGTGFAGSNCAYVGFGNDAWTSALELPRTGQTLEGDVPVALELGTADVIEQPGGTRWYKFPVRPNARATIDLTGLPADYDLSVFTDIDQEYVDLTTATAEDAINRLGAEFAPSAYSPSAYSPSAYSPSAYSPSAYSPSAYSPSAYSDSVYAPSAYSPSAYSPSAYSPSAYSPSAYSPSAYSPSAYSSDTFDPDEFSAGAFAPSAYSPDASSPSAYSPSAYSPSAYSPSAYSPSAYSAAQVQALVTVSANPGTADELSLVNTWNNDTYFYVRVLAKPDVASVEDYEVTVSLEGASCIDVTRALDDLPDLEPIVAQDPDTVIVWDSQRLSGDPLDIADVAAKLEQLATATGGVVVDLQDHERVQAYQAQADAEPQCVYATNLVAEAVKDVIDTARTPTHDPRHVVIVGGDSVVPFFRYPDTALLGPESDYVPPVDPTSRSEAALRENYVLGQDQYGAETVLSLGGMQVPVPQLAVGRVVETPTEIIGMIDQYLDPAAATPTPRAAVRPDSTLVTGYDFMIDAAEAIQDEFRAGTGPDALGNDALIAPVGQAPGDPDAWTAVDLRAAWLDQPPSAKHDLIYLAGHFSANSALAADYQTQLVTTEVAPSGVDLAGSIVFSNGCHSGYNIVDGEGIDGLTLELDWAQAMAQQQATLIAGTGYQYGDTDLTEYSERLYAGFARELRRGTGDVAVGEALVRAKREYLASTPDPRGLHRKSLLIATVFGLPMTSVDMPGERFDDPPATGIDPRPVASDPGTTLGLEVASVEVGAGSNLTEQSVTLDILDDDGLPVDSVEASYLTPPSGRTAVQPNEPILPLLSTDVTATGTALRGVAFRGGTYRDSPDVIPLSSAAGTELRGVHVPFASEVFFPMRVATANYYDALPGGTARTRLLVTPVQHRVDQVGDAAATRRVFEDLDLDLYYSNNTQTYTGTDEFGDAFSRTPALAAPPQIAGVRFSRVVATDGSPTDDLQVEVGVVGDPAAGMQSVWITTTTGPDASGIGTWVPVELTRSPSDSRLWRAVLPGAAASTAPALDVIAHAVNGVGLVSTDDNYGRYHRTGGSGVRAPGQEPPAQTASSLTIEAPATAIVGDEIPITVTLTDAAGSPVAGRVLVTFGTGGQTITTDDQGQAQATFPVSSDVGLADVTATFRGAPEASPPLAPSSATERVRVERAPTALTLTAESGRIVAVLTSTGAARVPEATILFDLDGDDVPDQSSITDQSGRATVTPSAVAGVVTVKAAYGGSSSLLASAGQLQLEFEQAGTPVFAPPVAPGETSIGVTATVPLTTGTAEVWLRQRDRLIRCGLDITSGSESATATATIGTVPGSACNVPVGVYEAAVVVTSTDDLPVARSASTMLVVFDPSGGSVSGAGWIVPSAGDDLPGFTGTDDKAHFGFNVRYQNGRSEVPRGTARFRYRVGDLRLDASGFQWLAVTTPTGALFQGRAEVTYRDVDGTLVVDELRPFSMDIRDRGDVGDEFGIKIYPPDAIDTGSDVDDLSDDSPEWRVARNVIGDGSVNVKTD